MFRTIGSFTLILASFGAQAALPGRLPATPGGTDYQAYYDDWQDITWLADGNLAVTHPFGVSGMGISTSGPATMDWNMAHEWIAAMNAATYLGVSDWRLPAAIDMDGPDPDDLGDDGCNHSYTGTDCGWNVDPASSEIAHLYYVTLGNIGSYDPSGVHQDCDAGHPAPPACLTNVGPFSNFVPNHYWTDLECPVPTLCPPDGMLRAVEFNARIGLQGLQDESRGDYVWAVRDGDIDSDEDGVAVAQDNCSEAFNPDQYDADDDGYGNRCDADLNSDAVTNVQDYAIFRSRLGTSDSAADLNGNGFVNAQDYAIFRSLLGPPPGPSGLACAGTIPCLPP